MKGFTKAILCVALAVTIVTAPIAATPVFAAAEPRPTTAQEVEYVKKGNYVVNWGVREETALFLSSYAEALYSEEYQFDALYEKDGGTSEKDAPNSELYSALKSLMKSKHTKETSYNETKSLYAYTDCQNNDHQYISSFYTAQTLTSAWNSGSLWNREHTWPQSKGLNGNDENDIMMLRPAASSVNSGRGNTAYGESNGYYVPRKNVRGDCARIVLYVYVRWGNTKYMWGSNGVIESLDILLKWMQEDPVDTWEMGRNDAVQSITGTRNVFVDYPEYAWLLFGENIPNTLSTPSGEAKTTECKHEYGEWITKQPTETADGYKLRTCYRCGENEKEILPMTGTNNDEKGCSSTLKAPLAGVSLLLFSGAAILIKKKSEREE